MTFTQEDLFDDIKASSAPWDDLPRAELRVDLVDGLRIGPTPGIEDLDAAIAMAELLYAEYMAYGTGGGQRLTDAQAVLTQRTLQAVLGRLGLGLETPWRDFSSFRSLGWPTADTARGRRVDRWSAQPLILYWPSCTRRRMSLSRPPLLRLRLTR